MEKSKLLSFYKREDIQKSILENARGREVAIKFGDKGFGKRPDILRYNRDILELAMKGATSFHISEERWSNPLLLNPEMRKEDQEKMRTGWDLIIDIDSPDIEYSKQTAHLIIELFKYHKINSISCKFSGNKGFHIGIPFEAMPSKIVGNDSKLMFPDTPKKVALYIMQKIMKPLSDKIIEIEKGDYATIAKKSGFEKKDDILKYDKDKGYDQNKLYDSIINMDTLLISSRHLYRSVYSFHEKSGLVSIPIDTDKILDFKKSDADPEKVTDTKIRFLDSSKADKSECRNIFSQAFDLKTPSPIITQKEKKVYKYKELDEIKEAIPAELFPPCITEILKGLRDGKKRSLFILKNFLFSCGWNFDEVEELVKEWNKKNPEKLRENIIIGELRYSKAKNKVIKPPNCLDRDGKGSVYKDIKICLPDNLCRKIRNPVYYSLRKKRFTKS